MSTNRIYATITFAFLALAPECIGESCNPHPLIPSMLPPCPTVGSQLADAVGQAQEINRRVGEMNAIIEGARRAFWKVFPDGPGFAAAEAAFSNALWQKDEYYFILSYPQGVTGDAARIMNVITFTPGMTLAEYQRNLHSDPKNIDGGIKRAAYPLFVEWINALRRAGGAQKDGQMASPMQFLKALSDRSNRRLAYEQARNFAEFEASGLDLAKYLTPKAYIQMLMQTRVSIRLAREKTDDMPDGQAATLALYDVFVRNMGEQEVLNAAAAVLHARRNPTGGLETYFPVEIGTDVREASYDPFLRFLSLLTEKNPRNYAIALLLDQQALLVSSNATYASKENWSAAVTEYNRLVAKYGESAVLNVAAKLRAAQKSPTGGIRGDPQARSVLPELCTPPGPLLGG